MHCQLAMPDVTACKRFRNALPLNVLSQYVLLGESAERSRKGALVTHVMVKSTCLLPQAQLRHIHIILALYVNVCFRFYCFLCFVGAGWVNKYRMNRQDITITRIYISFRSGSVEFSLLSQSHFTCTEVNAFWTNHDYFLFTSSPICAPSHCH